MVVPEDRDGEADEHGDEALEQPPPTPPLFYPSSSGYIRPCGKRRRAAGKQPLSPALSKFWSRAVGQTTPFPVTPQATLHLTVGHAPTFLVLNTVIRKNGEGKGEWQKDPAKGGTWHWQPLPGGPRRPVGERVGSGAWGPMTS